MVSFTLWLTFVSSIATAAASSTCCSSQQQEQQINGRTCQITCNQDRPGGDYANKHTKTFSDCMKACANDDKCLTAQYYKGICYFKNSVHHPVKSSSVDSVLCQPVQSQPKSGGTASVCPAAPTFTTRITITKTTSATTCASVVTQTAPAATQSVTVTQTVTTTVGSIIGTGSVMTVTQSGSTVIQTVIVSSSLPITITAPALPVATTTTATSTITTTARFIPGYNVTDSMGCLDGRLYNINNDEIVDTYVEVCNVSFDGNDIGVGTAGNTPDNIEQCAQLCSTTEDCKAAIFHIFPDRNACFLKDGVRPTHFTQGYDMVFLVVAPYYDPGT